MERRVAGQTSRFSLDPPSLSKVHGNALVNGMIRVPEHFLGTPGHSERKPQTQATQTPISPSQSSSWPVMYSSSVAGGVQASLPLDDFVLSDPGLSLRAKVTEEKEEWP